MMKRYYGEPTVAFASDVSHLGTEVVFPPQVLGQADDLAGELDYAVEFYVADTRGGRPDGPSVVLNTASARQLAAELLNRADQVDEFIAAQGGVR